MSTTKQRRSKLFHRTSLLVRLKPKHRSNYHDSSSEKKLLRKSRTRRLIRNLHQTYHSMHLTVTLIFRLFTLIDRITRELFLFLQKLIRIIEVIYGWIQMIRAILSALHLVISRIMLLISYVYRIFHLLTILLEPFANRTFEKSLRSFSHFFYNYYSSNGACYTLEARTRHIVGRVRRRWTRKLDRMNDVEDDDIYYDALDDE